MCRVLKIAGWIFIGLFALALFREGWTQTLIGILGLLFGAFVWGAITFQ